MHQVRRLGVILGALVIAGGCGTVSQPSTAPSAGPVDSPAAVITTPSPAAPSPTPRITATPRPSPAPACPTAGSSVSFETFATLPAGCAPLELVLAGWWDTRRESDLPDATSFGQVLRERLPVEDPEEEPEVGRTIPLDIREIEVDTALLEGRWAELRVQLAEDGTGESEDPHCSWSIRTDEPVSASLPPTLTCPRYARVLGARVADPPAGALDACPNLARVMSVERFVQYPRACFDGKTVRLRGWLDTHYVIGGWEAPWEIRPGWLWSQAIGPVVVLAPTSDATDWENLRLHIPPGSAVGSAPQNRWVVLEGHYARESESEACRYEYPADWYGGDNPAAGTLDDADARADCAQAFIAESVRDSEPN